MVVVDFVVVMVIGRNWIVVRLIVIVVGSGSFGVCVCMCGWMLGCGSLSELVHVLQGRWFVHLLSIRSFVVVVVVDVVGVVVVVVDVIIIVVVVVINGVV